VRGLLILVAVLVVLAGLFVAERMGEQAGEPYSQALTSLDTAEVARIEIAGPEGRTVLERRPEGWRLTEPVDYPADPDLVSATLSALTGLTSRGVISSNPDKAAVFEVDEQHGIRVALYYADDTEPRARIVVGKLSPGFSGTYVMVDGGPEVHDVPGALRFQLERDATAWRDKTVLAFDPAAITRVALRGATTAVVARSGDGWRWADGEDATSRGAVSTEAVERLVKQLSALRASGFVDEPPPPPDEPLLAVTLTGAREGNPVDLVVEAEQEGRYRMVAEANPQRFLVLKGVLEPFVTDPVAAVTAPDATPAPPAPAAPPS
jgi:hypothetical protein